MKSVVPNVGGIYRLINKGTDGKFYVFYVGQANDLEARLLDHLASWEPNTCIKNKVRSLECHFRFARVPTKAERDRLEAQEVREYQPACNTQLR